MTFNNEILDVLNSSHDLQDKIKELRNAENIVGLSGGKDSLATCIILYYLGIPFRTVTAEVWWKKRIPGDNPYHYEFLHNKAVPILQSWGVNCDFVSSNITAYDYMTTPIAYSVDHPERVGKLRGFPLCGACGIQRDCKTRPCEKYYKKISTPHNIITGIASNEETRAYSNAANGRISILEMLGIKEGQAYHICRKEKLLSPIYSFSDRNGCWFCPNQKIWELEFLYREFPHLWDELMEIQKMPNKVQENFTRTQTLFDIEAEIKHGVQIKLFV